MSRSNHPIEHEELMAYLDGELATDRAVAAAAHLERCQECQELAAELKKISQELMTWEVEEPGNAEISTEVAVALEKRRKEPRRNVAKRNAWGVLFAPRRLAWGGVLSLVGLLVISISIPNMLRSPRSAQESARMSRERERARLAGKGEDDAYSPRPAPTPSVQTYAYDSLSKLQNNGGITNTDGLLQIAPGVKGKTGVAASERTLDLPTIPMIARTAGLTLTTNEFEKTRAGLEEILKRYHGYLSDLKVSAPAEAGRSLTATLRIPAPQLDAAMAELKTLGRVENEAQDGEEVTQQYVDLEARLKNSQHTEQRLIQMLAQRTGKLQDVLKVELEIDRVRGEIEQMQAEKKELSKRVSFATLSMIINEEYHAKLQAAPPSTGSRFRNAAVEGYNTVVEGLIDVGLFLFSAGPSLLLWAAILFFPARWVWKKVREKTRQAETSLTE